jgi:hypothetical protein
MCRQSIANAGEPESFIGTMHSPMSARPLPFAPARRRTGGFIASIAGFPRVATPSRERGACPRGPRQQGRDGGRGLVAHPSRREATDQELDTRQPIDDLPSIGLDRLAGGGVLGP